jgi:hypothetical protein
MRVFFTVGLEFDSRDDDLTYIHEDVLRKDFEPYREFFMRYDWGHERGALNIEFDEQNHTCIKDELRYMVTHLCFRAVPALLKDETYLYRYTDYYSTTELTSKDNNIYISGKHHPSLTTPRHPLLNALYECGLRYLEFLLYVDTERYTMMVKPLRQEADTAKAALDAAANNSQLG